MPRNPHPISPAPRTVWFSSRYPEKPYGFPTGSERAPFFAHVLAQAPALHALSSASIPPLTLLSLAGSARSALRALPLTPFAIRGRIRSVDS